MKPTIVIFTIDTEHGVGGYPIKISGDLSMYGIKENYGVQSMMDIFESYDMHAVFFTNIYEADTFDHPNEKYMQKIIQEIHNRGHEVGLHWHSLSINKPYYSSAHPSKLSLEEQTEMIKRGVEFVKKNTGIKPISYRAGAYRINDYTLHACEINGIKFESSVWFGNKNNAISYYRTINAPYRQENIVEVPIASIVSHSGKNQKLDLDCLSIDELLEAIQNMRNLNYPLIQIMFHSFSFLKKAENNYDVLFRCKDKLYAGGDPDKKEKLDKLLHFLHLSPDFEVKTFRELNDYSIDFSIVCDGFVPTNSKYSNEMSIALNISNPKIIPVNNIKLEVSVYHYLFRYCSSTKMLSFSLENNNPNCRYAFYLQNEQGDTLKTLPYQDSSYCEFDITHDGIYRIKFYIKDDEDKVSYTSKCIEIHEEKSCEIVV